jgi:selenocysteine-specific elongation factor
MSEARSIVGVIGHVDHGKTALVRALTGTDTDRLPEEKRRGISIALGFAHRLEGGVVLDFIDTPGHERFVRTMVSGATGIDTVLMAVSANEGIKPQTEEHLNIAALLGVRRVVIAITKADLVDATGAEVVACAAGELAARAGVSVIAQVVTSAVTGQGIAALARALASPHNETADDSAGFPYLPIDRVFAIPGHGTVVTGTLRRGSLSLSDEVELMPAGRAVRLRALQVHGCPVTKALPGQRVAANLRDVQVTQIASGSALVGAGVLLPSRWLDVWLRTVGGAPALRNGSMQRLHFGTAEVAARVRLLERAELTAGQGGPAQLYCEESVSIPAREPFILRRPSPPMTVAGGRVLRPDGHRVRRHDPEVMDLFQRLAEASPEESVLSTVSSAGAAGVPLAALARLAGVTTARVAEWLRGADIRVGTMQVAVTTAEHERTVAAVRAQLSYRPAGLTLEQLRSAVPFAGTAVLEEAVLDVLRQGEATRAGGLLQPHGSPIVDARQQQDARDAHELAETFRRAGLCPPDAADNTRTRRLIDRLVHEGVLVRARDERRARDVLFHRDAVADARRRLLPLLAAAPGLLVAEVGGALEISRKYSLALLVHLDRIRFTRRVGDRRILGPAHGRS